MQPHEIEAWALRVIDRVIRSQPIEDAFEEAKREWLPSPQAARRIAAHCNAARGAPVLWVVGADQKAATVPGAPAEDVAKWWPSVRAEFDGVTPEMTTLNVSVAGTTVVAILFDTARAPYVVRNPSFGTVGGGAVAFEVPWREATSTRTARREDLVNLLSPLQLAPSVEVVRARIAIESAKTEAPRWSIRMGLYITPRGDSGVVFPRFKSRLLVNSLNAESLEFKIPKCEQGRPPYRTVASRKEKPRPSNVTVTDSEVILKGPGMIEVFGSWNKKASLQTMNIPLELSSDLPAAGTSSFSVRATCKLSATEADQDSASVARWQFNPFRLPNPW